MTKARDLASAAPAPSTVSATEIGYLDGVTSAIQTQLGNKQDVVANVDNTEIGYLNGVTSLIQTQIDGKSGTSHNHNSDYIAKTLTTTTGDIIYASSANTPARLGIGSTSQVLTVSGGVPTWAAPASGSYTQIGSTLTLSGTTNSFTSIPATYNKLVLYVLNVSSASNSMEFQIAINNTSGNLIIPGLARWGTDAIVSTLTTDYIRPISANMLNNNTDNAWIVEIENYASTTAYKKISAFVTYMSDTSSKRMTYSFNGFWTSNSAVTSIGLNSASPSINNGTAKLYGVK